MLTDDMTEVFIISGHTVQSVRQELRSVWMSGQMSMFLTALNLWCLFFYKKKKKNDKRQVLVRKKLKTCVHDWSE